jgi:hypothetical protein
MIFFLKGNHGLFTNGQRTYRDINKVFDDPGKVSFRGSVLFRSPSNAAGGKLSSINNTVAVFE